MLEMWKEKSAQLSQKEGRVNLHEQNGIGQRKSKAVTLYRKILEEMKHKEPEGHYFKILES